MVYVVGIGPGSIDYILPKALEVLSKCDIVVGFSRAIDSLSSLSYKTKKVTSLKEIVNFINTDKSNVAIIASGDPTFYGIGDYIKNNYSGKVEIVPGISSFQYLTCKLGKSWSNAVLGSLHGRDDDFIKKVSENKLSIWLTDSKNSPEKLCRLLSKNEIECNVFVGENLSYDNERIIVGTPMEVGKQEFGKLTIFIVERSGD